MPGFGLSLGITMISVGLIVLIPLSALVLKTATLSWASFWKAVSDPRALAAYRLSFGAALLAALVNAVFGVLLAWVLTRYRFPGRKIVDALVDLPFALPTAIAGLTLATLYSKDGLFGAPLAALGIKGTGSALGVVIALIFVGLPFVVRTVQPVMEELDPALEEAAASLGASRWQTLRHVVAPQLFPSLLTGATLSFARGVGEFGSVIFVAGNMPYQSEITPLLIVSRLEEYDYAGATALAVVMLGVSFVSLLAINLLQRWSAKRRGVLA